MLILASLLTLTTASGIDVPARSAESYTEAEIYTEPHNAAAAAISTQNFIVGRMAQECYAAVGKPESFVQEFTQSWQQRNQPYLSAATMYAANVLSYYERTRGPEAKAAVYNEFVRSVRGHGAESVAESFASGSRTDVCTRFILQVEDGTFDIKPSHPFFRELTELVQIKTAFGS